MAPMAPEPESSVPNPSEGDDGDGGDGDARSCTHVGDTTSSASSSVGATRDQVDVFSTHMSARGVQM